MSNRQERFEDACQMAEEIFILKNKLYGDSIRFGGVLSACYNIVGAAMRLIPLVFQSAGHGQDRSETVEDILIDIHNYASIALMFIKEHNWLGEET